MCSGLNLHLVDGWLQIVSGCALSQLAHGATLPPTPFTRIHPAHAQRGKRWAAHIRAALAACAEASATQKPASMATALSLRRSHAHLTQRARGTARGRGTCPWWRRTPPTDRKPAHRATRPDRPRLHAPSPPPSAICAPIEHASAKRAANTQAGTGRNALMGRRTRQKARDKRGPRCGKQKSRAHRRRRCQAGWAEPWQAARAEQSAYRGA